MVISKNAFGVFVLAALISVAHSCAGESGATSLIDEGLARQPSRAAGLLRAGFHDCITATMSKSGSGCNGSLRLGTELRYKGNIRMSRTIAFLRPIQRTSFVSWADLFQLGVERAMVKTGGPNVFLGGGRRDANSADENTLPGEKTSYSTLKTFFKNNGFNVRQMVVAQVGGHAIGKFKGK